MAKKYHKYVLGKKALKREAKIIKALSPPKTEKAWTKWLRAKS